MDTKTDDNGDNGLLLNLFKVLSKMLAVVAGEVK
jgi:hypothetical protein